MELLKENDLKVFYGGKKIKPALDEAIEKTLAKFGYRRWASGYDLDGKVRDLAFDKMKPDKKCKNFKQKEIKDDQRRKTCLRDGQRLQ